MNSPEDQQQEAKYLPVHVLRNARGMEVHVSPIGCVIQRLLVPDKNSNIGDVVLGFDEEKPYLDGSSPYFGAVVGRVANRIAGAEFDLEGHTYHLYANSGAASLHGGKVGFDKRVWSVVDEEGETDKEGSQGKGEASSSLLLQYVSQDGEEGYPGTLTAHVRYSLWDDQDMLQAEFSAEVEGKATLVSLAQHSYFNLGGHDSGTVLGHHLRIPQGDHTTPVDSGLIPTGEIAAVNGTPFDFTTFHKVGERIADVGPEPGYDHNYVLFGLGKDAAARTKHGSVFDEPQLAATVWDPVSGRAMDVSTTAPGMQVYSGNFLDGKLRGKGGSAYPRHGALCLETQLFPDAPHHPNFPSAVLQPGERYRHVVQYRFYTHEDEPEGVGGGGATGESK